MHVHGFKDACSCQAWRFFIHKHAVLIVAAREEEYAEDVQGSWTSVETVWPASLSEWARLLSVHSERKATWMQRDRWSKWLPSVNIHQGQVERASSVGLCIVLWGVWVNMSCTSITFFSQNFFLEFALQIRPTYGNTAPAPWHLPPWHTR